jgi:predicted XRE-type DNA-binding protein
MNIDLEKGSENIFSDLGFDNPEQELLKAQLAYYIHQAIKEEELTQLEAAERIGVRQPDISKLMHGHYSRFSAERMFKFLNKLGYNVDIRIKKASLHSGHVRLT